MSKKIIKVTCKENTEFFLKKVDIARKYNYTAQYIGEILNGKTKKNYIVHENNVYSLEYITDKDTIQKYSKNIKEKINDNSDKENKEQNIQAKEPFDYFLKFLNETTNKTDKKEDFIKITSLYEKFQCCNYYLDCKKDVRRNIYTLKNMKDYF